MFDVNKIRKDFPILNQPGEQLVYLDNGATTFKPQSVIDAVLHYYTHNTANIHRGDYDNSFAVSAAYDRTRDNVADFINCQPEEVVFTSGDTAALNLTAYSFGMQYLQKGDVVLSTESEHASSILPWFRVARLKEATIEYIPLTADGQLTLASFQAALHDKVKVVVTTHVSNVVGYINPIKEMARLTHQIGAYIVVDGAQSVPHMKVDVQDLDLDFLAFSAHKMLGPTGVGVLYGRSILLKQMEPLFLGGGSNARFDRCGNLTLKKAPDKFEAGTPAIEGVLGLNAAIDYLRHVGMDNIQHYEEELRKYLMLKLSVLDNVIIYNPLALTGIVAMNVKGIFSQDAAAYLNYRHIAVRAGNHCAKILKDVLKTTDTIRCSLYFYNTKEEIDLFVAALQDVTIENCVSLII
ncbi:MAG: aminotransferase class V-fold PLP-dependent enzyme [Erysipelotrichaceae bacterium]|nr:aminotransferase class V-fold PLP-dependent enzyme [Erysipelotrichaceae bacterium]